MSVHKGYSSVQIALHWGMAALILGQLIFGGSMSAAFQTALRGEVPVVGATVWGHIIGGMSVLLLVIWRLVLRVRRGVPPPPASGSVVAERAAKLVHVALYGLMIVAPLTGFVAWFGLNGTAGQVHHLFKPAFVLLIVIHTMAALWHQFWLKDGVLLRMKRPLD